jgi:hypothetical protein
MAAERKRALGEKQNPKQRPDLFQVYVSEFTIADLWVA